GPSTSSKPCRAGADERAADETFGPQNRCPGWSAGCLMAETVTLPSIAEHGASRLPSVHVDIYNIELKDDEGFIGDRASKGAFRDIIENWRKPLRKAGDDPFGEESSDELSKKALDTLLAKGDPEAAGILQGAIE